MSHQVLHDQDSLVDFDARVTEQPGQNLLGVLTCWGQPQKSQDPKILKSWLKKKTSGCLGFIGDDIAHLCRV